MSFKVIRMIGKLKRMLEENQYVDPEEIQKIEIFTAEELSSIYEIYKSIKKKVRLNIRNNMLQNVLKSLHKILIEYHVRELNNVLERFEDKGYFIREDYQAILTLKKSYEILREFGYENEFLSEIISRLKKVEIQKNKETLMVEISKTEIKEIVNEGVEENYVNEIRKYTKELEKMLGIKIPEEIIKLLAAREQLLTNKLEKILPQMWLEQTKQK